MNKTFRELLNEVLNEEPVSEATQNWEAKSKVYDKIKVVKQKLSTENDLVKKKTIQKELKALELELKEYE